MATFVLQHDDSGVPLLRVSGEIDAETAPALLKAASDAIQALVPLRIELREVAFMDSTGLHALVTIKQSAAEVGSNLHVVRVSAATERLFELTGTRGYFMPEASV